MSEKVNRLNPQKLLKAYRIFAEVYNKMQDRERRDQSPQGTKDAARRERRKANRELCQNLKVGGVRKTFF